MNLLAMTAAVAALAFFAAANVGAQQRPVSNGPRITLPSHANHFSWEGNHGFHGGVFIVERALRQAQDERALRQAQDERVREVVREVAVTPPPTPSHQGEGRKRKPYVIGGTYASLPPQGCMKMIEDGASYYFCSGEWYRQLGTGRVAKYRAVARP